VDESNGKVLVLPDWQVIEATPAAFLREWASA
jgi:hypothetical protein